MTVPTAAGFNVIAVLQSVCVDREVKQSAHVAAGSSSAMWRCTRLSQPARHAASVRSRTIMKSQPLAGAAADLSNVRLGTFLPWLTESTADRWLKATTQLFLSFNGEENGTWPTGRTPPLSPGCFVQLSNWRWGWSWLFGRVEWHAALSGTRAAVPRAFCPRFLTIHSCWWNKISWSW